MIRYDQTVREPVAKQANTALDLMPACPLCGAEIRGLDRDWIKWECGTTLRLIPPFRGRRSSICNPARAGGEEVTK